MRVVFANAIPIFHYAKADKAADRYAMIHLVESGLASQQEASVASRMLGVARIIGDPDAKTGEFAVLVGDAWQGMGIGSNLLEKCLSIAGGFRHCRLRERDGGIRTITKT
jgi:GNAT superfamily N-acetyltransferase